jgi:ankyrin
MEESKRIILAGENGGVLADEEPRRASFLFPVPRPAETSGGRKLDQDLLLACYRGNLEAVQRLVKARPELLAHKDAAGMGPVLTATHKNHLAIVEALLDAGGDIYEADDTETSALCYSVVLGYHDISKMLIERGASPIGDPSVPDRNRPIHFAAVGGHIEFCKYLMQKGASLLDKGLSDGTPCRSATIANNLQFVQWAIETEPRVLDAVDSNGLGLVIAAIESGATSVLKWFVEVRKMEWTHLRGMFDLTVVQLAARSGSVEILKWMVSKGLPLEERWGDAGLTPIQLAAQEARYECIKVLVQAGVDVVRDVDNVDTTCLHWAAHNGHDKVVELLLSMGCVVDAVDTARVTPLMYAATNGHLQVCRMLIEHGAKLDLVSDEQKSPFLYACTSGKVPCAEWLYLKGANPLFCVGQNGLLIAARKNRLKMVQWLLSRWPELAEGRDSDGDSALALAFSNNFMELGKWFLDHPEYGLTLKDPSLVNAMRTAAGNGHLEPISFLMKKGIAFDQPDEVGNTPLAFAAHFGHEEIIEFLVKAGADIERVSDTFRPIHFAARQGKLKAYKKLVLLGANYKALIDPSKESVLHLACQSGCVELVEFLLEQGFDPSEPAKGPSGNYPILNAAISGHHDIIKLLSKAGAKWNVKASNGWTPAFYAAASGFLQILEECFEKGLSMVETDDQGYTPFLLAAYNGENHVIRWLLSKGGASIADYFVPNEHNAISMAIQGGQLETVKMLIEEFHMPTSWPVEDVVKTHGTTCGKYGKPDIYEWMVANGHLQLTPLTEDTDPLFEACAAGHLPFVKMLHRLGYPLNIRVGQVTPFMFACHSNSAPLVRWFLRQGVSPLQWDGSGEASWSYADRDGDVYNLLLPLVNHAAGRV